MNLFKASELRTLIFIFTIVLISCNQKKNEGWKTLDFRVFKLEVPGDWRIVKLQGTDSYVGGLTNGTDSLYFDYGSYSPAVGDQDPDKHKFAIDTVNGLSASIVIPIVDGDGQIAMSVSNFRNAKNTFIIGGRNIKGTNTILRIFKSIMFSESNGSKNPMLTLDRFKCNLGGSGFKLYKANCASCHRKDERAIGSALKGVATRHTLDWTFNFLTNRSSLKSDSTYQRISKGKNYYCPEFTELKKEEVDNIIKYIN